MQCRAAAAQPKNGLVVSSIFLSLCKRAGLLDSLASGNESQLGGMGPELA